MSVIHTCSVCGQALPEGVPEALCPACALRDVAEGCLGLEPKVGAEDDERKPEEVGPAIPRQPAHVQDRSPGPAPVIPPASLPRSFGDYELLDEVGRGGMGVVYRARQRSLNRIVALKMVVAGPMASPTAIQRFRAEAQAAASLQHPHIVAIHEVGDHEGLPFFSMDCVAGRDLAELLRDGPLPPKQTAGYAKTIAEAIEYAHQHGVIHRDLKPSNILIDEHDQPRITDFGLAKRLPDKAEFRKQKAEIDLTVSGQVLGSPNFMAPEQAQGRHREVGPASDVYSLGAVLYHLLTGRPPFQAATRMGSASAIVRFFPDGN